MADKTDVKGAADTKGAAEKGTDKAGADAAAKPAIKHVKMKRKHPQHPGGPTSATVHPSEVRNFSEAGWYEEKE
jgi:hypothetical protein